MLRLVAQLSQSSRSRAKGGRDCAQGSLGALESSVLQLVQLEIFKPASGRHGPPRTLVPSEVAQLNLGEAQLGQGNVSDAAGTYHGLEKFGPRGASLAASALADLALYQGRFSEQVRLLEQGANADLQAKTPENATNKFAALAYAQLLRGQSGAAVASAEKALANGQTMQVRFLAGRVFAEAGDNGTGEKNGRQPR